MKELIKKQKEELDKLEYEWMCHCREKYKSIDKEDIYSWHINSIKEILDVEVERLANTEYEVMNPPINPDSFFTEEMIVKAKTKSEAYKEQTEHLKNIISNLK